MFVETGEASLSFASQPLSIVWIAKTMFVTLASISTTVFAVSGWLLGFFHGCFWIRLLLQQSMYS